MANKEIKTRIQQRYDTEANWTSKNPVLLTGELAISSDKNGQYKIGNGTSKWSQLEYNKIPWGSIINRPTSMKNPNNLNILFNGQPWETYNGETYKEIDISPGNIGAASGSHSHNAATSTAAGFMSAADKKKIDKIGILKTCTLTISGWSSTSPYTQTVSVTGITSSDNPLISLDIPVGTTADNEKAMNQAFALLSNVTTGSGTITFMCISKKPETIMSLNILLL